MPKSRDVNSDPADASPLDGEEFLQANRSNRERYRSEAERKAAKAARKRSSGDDVDSGPETTQVAEDGARSNDTETVDSGTSTPDRTPRKLDASTGSEPSRSSSWLSAIGSRPWAVLLLLVVGVALAASTIALSVAYVDADRRADEATATSAESSTVLETARRYATEISTYNSADYSDLDRRIREISTPSFTQTYIESSQDARRGSTEARAVSTAAAENAGIMAIEDGKAVVLVTLDQTVKAPDTAQQFPDGVPYQSRVKVTLVNRDGRWLMDDFDVL